MVINPTTMRGIPVSHLICAHLAQPNITFLLSFTKRQVPAWKPRLAIIDKDMSELNGIKEFANDVNLTIVIFICWFHVQQALGRWMTKSANSVPDDLADFVQMGFSKLHHAPTADDYLERRRLLLDYVRVVIQLDFLNCAYV
jgi:hypothetical protein